PIGDLGGALTAQVSFGDERMMLPLRAGARPGELLATLVPTRAGTYSFRIAGRVRGQVLDTTSTCSDTTFACVTDVSEAEFPAKDPSPGQLAERLARGLPRAERARSTADTAEA